MTTPLKWDYVSEYHKRREHFETLNINHSWGIDVYNIIEIEHDIYLSIYIILYSYTNMCIHFKFQYT